MLRKILVKIIVSALRLYQVCVPSVFYTQCCRFYPTCSEYAISAIELHGPFKGTFMGIKRILRCHPFHPGGYDPVE
ncbi:MAG TPA: membrane protein insertion efficiency factor YidD [Smithellaceae bacterium]|nr:membrane protein insertion efficiency factor YidD [Syntrophaceae bacterium]MDX9815621.1 membrane protein insertion efficiency factor YidD [Smithellaceae bacterium]NMD05019.1 membrane protein insertion efficiency factor YidD [Deltaproteobacteria bacterium]MBP8608856.1 membrane protein insertion efficiency factor YidD [Syntrophaceae bacterium]HNQ19137.1 membrane protein insertion efficiency factor YidD [Smithellaceae bacterium]